MSKKYRNKFESKIAGVLGDLCLYESLKVPYTISKNYIPDFVGEDKRGIQILVEAKGYFRVGDTQKYTSIRDSIGPYDELVFLLYDHKKKIRKGAKMNMGQWCEKESLRWFTIENIRDAFTV